MLEYRVLDAYGRCGRVLVLPDPEDGPSRFDESGVGLRIALAIARDLGFPELGVLPRRPVMIRATVPIATVHEDRDPWTHEDDVSSSPELRKWSRVDSIPEASRPKVFAQREFRPGIAAPVASHHRPDGRGARPGTRRGGRSRQEAHRYNRLPCFLKVSSPRGGVDLSDVARDCPAAVVPANVGADPARPRQHLQND